MKALRFLLPAAVVAGSLLVTTNMAVAKPEYMKKEKKACVVCHVTAKSKDLNEVGKCYKDHNHTLTACDTKKSSVN